MEKLSQINQTNQSLTGIMWKTVSEACNLACSYCYYSRTKGRKPSHIKRVDSVLLKKVIKEYMGLSRGEVSFSWQGGEPLLAGLDFFEEVVYYQAKYAPPNTMISNSVQTNATLLNADWARFLKKYNFLVGVSLDGPKDINDSHRVTRSGVGSYLQVIKGIEYLRRADVDFNILTVLHEHNIGRVEELFAFYREEGFNFVQFIPGMDFKAQETSKAPGYLITSEEYGRFLCRAFDLWFNNGFPTLSVRFFDNILRVYLDQEPEICMHRQICPTTLILEQNGDAFPCDFYMSDDYRVGNLRKDSLVSILKSITYEHFLQKKASLPSKCQGCEFLKFCHGGCPRSRLWNPGTNEIDGDYFCSSYKQVYQYSRNSMQNLADRLSRS
ncbi:anaerobic sulfatase maturase [Desulfosporosinus sp. FKA]|uniref:anaerobic sulfatase maturase n=1 Tax=Desulfosporosinus sp. FKA TaxID=1969834 RepID=UPI000B4979F7|nr:anaerobic sulfatase maturase [Desulfosporosinus sp. FKA]